MDRGPLRTGDGDPPSSLASGPSFAVLARRACGDRVTILLLAWGTTDRVEISLKFDPIHASPFYWNAGLYTVWARLGKDLGVVAGKYCFPAATNPSSSWESSPQAPNYLACKVSLTPLYYKRALSVYLYICTVQMSLKNQSRVRRNHRHRGNDSRDPSQLQRSVRRIYRFRCAKQIY